MGSKLSLCLHTSQQRETKNGPATKTCRHAQLVGPKNINKALIINTLLIVFGPTNCAWRQVLVEYASQNGHSAVHLYHDTTYLRSMNLPSEDIAAMSEETSGVGAATSKSSRALSIRGSVSGALLCNPVGGARPFPIPYT